METKQVDGYFGVKQVTREEFVRQWTDHFMQFYSLPCDATEMRELDRIKSRLAEMAGRAWDDIK